MSDNNIISEEVFRQVAAIVGDKSITPVRSATFAERSRLYGLYKRATLGRLHPPYGDDDIETETRPESRPLIIFVEAQSKYDAWEKEDNISKEEARQEYVKLAEELVGEPVKKVISKAAE